jgi:penicillin-binding protein 1A
MTPVRRRVLTDALIGLCIFLAAALGIGVGLGLAATRNVEALSSFGTYRPALPTEVLDRNGNLITQFFSDQKRDLVSLNEIPKHLINALLTREDKTFFKHRGWDPLGLVKAVVEWAFLGRPLRGASTITQQLAGWTYEDRQEISVRRKLAELWWAWQMERRMTKEEILEQYLNEMPLGHNTYGVEAASQFYFRKSVREVTLAEAAVLVVIFANPSYYSLFKNPQAAKERSRGLLDDMVRLRLATLEEADRSFAEYWDNYDWSRSATSSAFFERPDKAPYFSEYIRSQLDDVLFGAVDVYRDGLKVYTTLDLEYQRVADEVMQRNIQLVDDKVQERQKTSSLTSRDEFFSLVDTLALNFDVSDFRVGKTRRRNDARRLFIERINPALDAVATMLSVPELKTLAQKAYDLRIDEIKESEVEGALVSIESTTGRILAMVGGRKWENTDQFNRATLARVQPGSSFKPLYYSAAIESRKATMATMFVDGPVRFTNPDGTFYEPMNFIGKWEGPVLLWWALADSKNVPSLKVFDMVGIEPAIDWTSTMLGLVDAEDRELAFRPPHGYPIGLGICGVSPLQMARAFATFPNGGQAVEPVGIVKILNRDGEVIAEPEKDARLKRSGRDARLLSPQTAAIMTEMLERVVKRGTLSGSRYLAGLEGNWDRPMAGKTGTTHNWVAAWTVGFSAQITTAIWFGFDQGSRSMGRSVTGATVGGPAWAEYMEAVHEGLPVREFKRPASGLVERTVCATSGLLPTASCPKTENLLFLEGTAPRTLCDLHPYQDRQKEIVIDRAARSPLGGNLRSEVPADMLESFEDDATTTGEGEGPQRSLLAD